MFITKKISVNFYEESILNECGLSYVWLNQYFIRFSISYVKNVLKVLLKLVSKISFAKLGMHILIPARKLFKNEIEFENYFNILDDRDIFTFCRIRLLPPTHHGEVEVRF